MVIACGMSNTFCNSNIVFELLLSVLLKRRVKVLLLVGSRLRSVLQIKHHKLLLLLCLLFAEKLLEKHILCLTVP